MKIFLEICAKYEMPKLKEHISDYLQQKYYYQHSKDHTFTKYLPFIFASTSSCCLSTLTSRKNTYVCLLSCLKILRLADQFELNSLRKRLLELGFIVPSFKDVCTNKDFQLLHDETKYELIMKAIRSLLPKESVQLNSSSVDATNPEGMILLSFFDILFYEGRTNDFSVARTFHRTEFDKTTKKRKVHNPFGIPDSNSHRIIEVGCYQLHVTASILSQNSPVFDRMLNGNFKETNQKVIRIEDVPDKIIRLFQYFYHYFQITGTINTVGLFL